MEDGKGSHVAAQVRMVFRCGHGWAHWEAIGEGKPKTQRRCRRSSDGASDQLAAGQVD